MKTGPFFLHTPLRPLMVETNFTLGSNFKYQLLFFDTCFISLGFGTLSKPLESKLLSLSISLIGVPSQKVMFIVDGEKCRTFLTPISWSEDYGWVGLWIGQCLLRNPTMIGLSLAIINQAFDPPADDYKLILIKQRMGMKAALKQDVFGFCF